MLQSPIGDNAHSQPSASADSQPQIENSVFDPQWVESADVKETQGYGGPTVYLLKKSSEKWTRAIQVVF